MNIAKLSEYEHLRRPSSIRKRSLSTLRRDAASGRIPGAFQMTDRGSWWVDLDMHDQIIKERIEMQMVASPAQRGVKPANEEHTVGDNEDDAVVSQILRDLNK